MQKDKQPGMRESVPAIRLPACVDPLKVGKNPSQGGGKILPTRERDAPWDQPRVTRVRVLHVAQKGRRFALLTIEDTTEVFCLKAALDNAEYAALAVAGPRWWEPGLTGRRKMHFEIGPRLCLVTSAAVPLAGEEEPIFSVSLLPVAKRGAAESPATNATTISRTLSEWR